MRLRWSIIAVIVTVVAVTGGWTLSHQPPPSRAPIGQLLDYLPADTRIASYTNWEAIRGGHEVKNAAARERMLISASEKDLSTRSYLAEFAASTQKYYGWSSDNIAWEGHALATDGELLVIGLGSVSPSTVTDHLQKLGYEKSGDNWTLSADELAEKVSNQPSIFTHIAIKDGVLVLSRTSQYLRKSLTAHGGKSLSTVRGARDTAASLAGASSAYVEGSKDSCTDMSLENESEETKTRARNALKPLGTLARLAYSGRGMWPDDHLRFVMTSGAGDSASRQLDLRRHFVTGAFIGRFGNVEDQLEFKSSHVANNTAFMDFTVNPKEAAFMDGAGPVLFAGCGLLEP